MPDVLITVALAIASANVLLGMMLAWGISGGDGTGTLLMGLLGLSVLASTVASFFTVAGLLDPVPRITLLVVLAVVAMGALLAFGATEGRTPHIWIGIGVAFLVVITVVAVGWLSDGREVPTRAIAITALPVLLTGASLLIDRIGSDHPDSDIGTVARALASLAAPPLLLMLAGI